jgi:hypothetical protein
VTATKLQTQMQTPHHISGTRNHLGIADAWSLFRIKCYLCDY